MSRVLHTLRNLAATLAALVLCMASSNAFDRYDGCEACGDERFVRCPEHRASDHELEAGAVFCSFYAECSVCNGTARVACRACDAPTRTPDPSAKPTARELAVARFAEYDAALGRPTLGAASEHFNVVLDLPAMKVGKARKSPHELVHLYLDRCEAVQRAYVELFSIDEREITARSEILLWDERDDHLRVGEALCDYTTDDPIYSRGLASIASIWVDPKKIKGDDALHRSVVHHVAHGIMNVQRPGAWTGKMRMGWADAGLASWFEFHLLDASGGFCFWQPATNRAFDGGDWRPGVRKLLSAKSNPPFDLAALMTLDTVDMTPEQRALGFSLIDFLATRDPAALNLLLKRMRSRTPSRDAIKAVCGQSLVEFEDAWRTWVRETYPRR